MRSKKIRSILRKPNIDWVESPVPLRLQTVLAALLRSSAALTTPASTPSLNSFRA
jgi:hypothetical protein